MKGAEDDESYRNSRGKPRSMLMQFQTRLLPQTISLIRSQPNLIHTIWTAAPFRLCNQLFHFCLRLPPFSPVPFHPVRDGLARRGGHPTRLPGRPIDRAAQRSAALR